MSLRPITSAWVLMASLLLAASSARAECIAPGQWLLDQESVELVFGGNVVGINQVADLGVRITFNVDRVWKGSAPKRLELYVYQLDAEMPTFDFARQYVVFATKMTGRSRQGVGITDDKVPVFKPVQCGALAYGSAEKSALVRDRGVGRVPD